MGIHLDTIPQQQTDIQTDIQMDNGHTDRNSKTILLHASCMLKLDKKYHKLHGTGTHIIKNGTTPQCHHSTTKPSKTTVYVIYL